LDPRIAQNRLDTAEKCGGCHEGRHETYNDTFHGKAAGLGLGSVAACSDCHTPHTILPASDPKSSVAPENLIKTCGNCHGTVSAGFVQYAPHVNPKDPNAKPAAVYWVWLAMTLLLVCSLGGFAIHTLFWIQRAIVAIIRKEIKPIHRHGDVWVRRFTLGHQLVHVTIVITFLTLAATGLPLKFHGVPWAQFLADLFGGIGVARYIHRVAGVLTFAYGFVFVGMLLNEIIIKKRTELLYGWKSMTPSPKDLIDAYHNIRWFFYMGPPPRLGRFTYWEKFDFFAVFWGVPVIGLSGLALWLHKYVGMILPGWALNLASIIHGDEALLATGFIFFIHFFHTHLRPESFPIDTVIFTGCMPLERLKEERPEEYAALKKSGELESLIVPAPTAERMQMARIFGFTALAVGLILGILMLVAGFKMLF